MGDDGTTEFQSQKKEASGEDDKHDIEQRNGNPTDGMAGAAV